MKNNKFWYITDAITVDCISVDNCESNYVRRVKEVGNCFETRAEARLAQKKIIKTLKGGKK